MKQAIITPGWPDTGEESKYLSLRDAFVSSGYQASILRPQWDKNAMSVWSQQLEDEIDAESESVTLLGFSMGAMATLLVSARVKIECAIICSAGGYFTEYKPLMTEDDLAWAATNLTDFDRYTTKNLFPLVMVNNGYIFVGEEELSEWPDFKQWMGDLVEATNWPISILPATGHDIGAVEYQKQLVGLISGLNISAETKDSL